MQIKYLAQGNNILLPGFEPSTSVTRNRHSNQATNIGKIVVDEARAVYCDYSVYWFHAKCEGIIDGIYKFLNAEDHVH